MPGAPEGPAAGVAVPEDPQAPGEPPVRPLAMPDEPLHSTTPVPAGHRWPGGLRRQCGGAGAVTIPLDDCQGHRLSEVGGAECGDAGDRIERGQDLLGWNRSGSRWSLRANSILVFTGGNVISHACHSATRAS